MTFKVFSDAYMLLHDFSVEDIASRLDVSVKTVYLWRLTDSGVPCAQNMIKLRNLFGDSVEDCFVETRFRKDAARLLRRKSTLSNAEKRIAYTKRRKALRKSFWLDANSLRSTKQRLGGKS